MGQDVPCRKWGRDRTQVNWKWSHPYLAEGPLNNSSEDIVTGLCVSRKVSLGK